MQRPSSLHLLAAFVIVFFAACAQGEPNPGLPVDPTDSETAEAPQDAGDPDAESDVADAKVEDAPREAAPPLDAKSADVTPADTSSVDTNPGDTNPGDTNPGDTNPGDTNPGDTAGCNGNIVSWDWSAGTGPALVTSSSSPLWTVGAANTHGPRDGATYLATAPDAQYANNLREWVRLPTIALGARAGCRIKISVELWRESEGGSIARFDGANLQMTTKNDAATADDWQVVDSGDMQYDGKLALTRCDASCPLYNQPVWAGYPGVSKTATFTSAAPVGAQLTLRFVFFSDDLLTYDGIYVKRLRVDAVP